MSGLWEQNWLLLVVAGAAAMGVAFFVSPEGPVARRIFGQFLFLIALPLAVIFGVALALLYAVTNFDPRIWQALIAGTVIAAGWLTTSIFTELERKRARDEKLRDYHKALYAEIGSTLEGIYADERAEEYAEAIVERMRGDSDFVPFIPRESHDRVFSAVLDKIEILPRQTIDPVIAYYEVLATMSTLAEDMRGDTFRTLEQERRIQMYLDYFETRKHVFALGQYTLGMINAFSEDGVAGAEAYKAGFSSPDAGQRPPSEGSV